MKEEKKNYTKSRLVKELSWKTELPQQKVKEVLETLGTIACREARGVFVLPGLCKFEVVRRRARKIRNPRTGEILVLPEHDALRIVAARAAKLAVAPKVTAIPLAEVEKTVSPSVPTPVPEVAPPPTPAPEVAPAPAPVPETVPAPAPAPEIAQPSAPVLEPEVASTPAPTPVKPEGPISFCCPQCHQEVEAPGEMAGEDAECPTCGNIIKIPYVSELGTVHGPVAQNVDVGDKPSIEKQIVSAMEAAKLYPSALKNRTIRINASDLGPEFLKAGEQEMVSFRCPKCRQEIEATVDMVGEVALCPNCATSLVVPSRSESGTLHFLQAKTDPHALQAMKSRTMRINIPDDF